MMIDEEYEENWASWSDNEIIVHGDVIEWFWGTKIGERGEQGKFLSQIGDGNYAWMNPEGDAIYLRFRNREDLKRFQSIYGGEIS